MDKKIEIIEDEKTVNITIETLKKVIVIVNGERLPSTKLSYVQVDTNTDSRGRTSETLNTPPPIYGLQRLLGNEHPRIKIGRRPGLGQNRDERSEHPNSAPKDMTHNGFKGKK